MAIRESRPIFKPRRQRAGLGPWMLLALLALLGAAGLYVYDQRHSSRTAELEAEIAQLRATVEGAAKARQALQGVASKQIALAGGQVAALWKTIKTLQDRIEAVEAALKARSAADAQARSAIDARAAAMLKDIAAIRHDLAALLARLAELEKRAPQTAPQTAPQAAPQTAPQTAPKTAPKTSP